MTDVQIESPAGNGYIASRFNAVSHGIMGRHTVLPWEDAAEYAGLVRDFMDDHRPEGATERHLVEELAGIVWRKRRLHQAEAGEVRECLAGLLIDCCSDAFDRTVDFIAYDRLAHLDHGEIGALLRFVEVGPEAAGRALAEVENAMARLDAEQPGEDDDELEWRRESVARAMRVLKALPVFHERAQQGATADPAFEKIARYETHLDRKFERTLAMLVKLRELRARRPARGAADAPAAAAAPA